MFQQIKPRVGYQGVRDQRRPFEVQRPSAAPEGFSVSTFSLDFDAADNNLGKCDVVDWMRMVGVARDCSECDAVPDYAGEVEANHAQWEKRPDLVVFAFQNVLDGESSDLLKRVETSIGEDYQRLLHGDRPAITNLVISAEQTVQHIILIYYLKTESGAAGRLLEPRVSRMRQLETVIDEDVPYARVPMTHCVDVDIGGHRITVANSNFPPLVDKDMLRDYATTQTYEDIQIASVAWRNCFVESAKLIMAMGMEKEKTVGEQSYPDLLLWPANFRSMSLALMENNFIPHDVLNTCFPGLTSPETPIDVKMKEMLQHVNTMDNVWYSLHKSFFPEVSGSLNYLTGARELLTEARLTRHASSRYTHPKDAEEELRRDRAGRRRTLRLSSARAVGGAGGEPADGDSDDEDASCVGNSIAASEMMVPMLDSPQAPSKILFSMKRDDRNLRMLAMRYEQVEQCRKKTDDKDKTEDETEKAAATGTTGTIGTGRLRHDPRDTRFGLVFRGVLLGNDVTVRSAVDDTEFSCALM